MNVVRLLLIEDVPGERELVAACLEGGEGISFAVAHAATLAEAKATLEREQFAAVLLDLGLPDSEGMDSLATVLRYAAGTPVLVITGTVGADLGVEAMRRGAEDFILKEEISREGLPRAILYAIVRHAQRRQDRQRLALLEEQLAQHDLEAIESGTEAADLPEALIREQVTTFAKVLEDAVEALVFRVDHDIEARLRQMARDLAEAGAGARDVIDVTTKAIREATNRATPTVMRVMAQEGSVRTLELMGYVVEKYRAPRPGNGTHTDSSEVTSPRASD